MTDGNGLAEEMRPLWNLLPEDMGAKAERALYELLASIQPTDRWAGFHDPPDEQAFRDFTQAAYDWAVEARFHGVGLFHTLAVLVRLGMAVGVNHPESAEALLLATGVADSDRTIADRFLSDLQKRKNPWPSSSGWPQS